MRARDERRDAALGIREAMTPEQRERVMEYARGRWPELDPGGVVDVLVLCAYDAFPIDAVSWAAVKGDLVQNFGLDDGIAHELVVCGAHALRAAHEVIGETADRSVLHDLARRGAARVLDHYIAEESRPRHLGTIGGPIDDFVRAGGDPSTVPGDVMAAELAHNLAALAAGQGDADASFVLPGEEARADEHAEAIAGARRDVPGIRVMRVVHPDEGTPTPVAADAPGSFFARLTLPAAEAPRVPAERLCFAREISARMADGTGHPFEVRGPGIVERVHPLPPGRGLADNGAWMPAPGDTAEELRAIGWRIPVEVDPSMPPGAAELRVEGRTVETFVDAGHPGATAGAQLDALLSDLGTPEGNGAGLLGIGDRAVELPPGMTTDPEEAGEPLSPEDRDRIIAKADATIAELTPGGRLDAAQLQRFAELGEEASRILADIDVEAGMRRVLASLRDSKAVLDRRAAMSVGEDDPKLVEAAKEAAREARENAAAIARILALVPPPLPAYGSPRWVGSPARESAARAAVRVWLRAEVHRLLALAEARRTSPDPGETTADVDEALFRAGLVAKLLDRMIGRDGAEAVPYVPRLGLAEVDPLVACLVHLGASKDQAIDAFVEDRATLRAELHRRLVEAAKPTRFVVISEPEAKP